MWQSPPVELALLSDEVHVWCADLSVPEHVLAAYQRSLSADEMLRAQRLHDPTDRRRFVARRGILRHLLSYYLGTKPAEILFTYTPYGKPILNVGDKPGAIRFTLSHASDQALYAVSEGRDIGIDIEYKQSPFDYEQIASTLFANEEYALLCALPVSQRSAAFFRLWACKEAYVKACGLGLSLSLDRFAILFDLDHPARLLYRHDQIEALHSNLRELSIGENYVAALAVEGNGWELRCWQYNV